MHVVYRSCATGSCRTGGAERIGSSAPAAQPATVCLRRDRDLGDIPQNRGAQIHHVGVLAADLVNQPAGIVLAAAEAGLGPADHLAGGEVDLVEPAGRAVGAVDVLLAAGV